MTMKWIAYDDIDESTLWHELKVTDDVYVIVACEKFTDYMFVFIPKVAIGDSPACDGPPCMTLADAKAHALAMAEQYIVDRVIADYKTLAELGVLGKRARRQPRR